MKTNYYLIRTTLKDKLNNGEEHVSHTGKGTRVVSLDCLFMLEDWAFKTLSGAKKGLPVMQEVNEAFYTDNPRWELVETVIVEV